MPELQDAVIVSAVRTAIGTYGGGLTEVPAVKLGEICIRAALERAAGRTGPESGSPGGHQCQVACERSRNDD